MCDDGIELGEISVDELVEKIKSDEYSLLCGNGLTKCVYGECWKNPDEEFYKIFLRDTLRLITEKELHIECSEKFFNFIRIEYGLKIFQYYQKLQKQIESTNYKYIPENFLKKFKNIYTLNYDVLIPRSNAKYKTHKDGFSKEAISACEIQERYGDNGLYYLHGAFHLLHISEENQQYKKITSDNDNGIDLLTAIQNVYQEVQQAFIDEKWEEISKNDPLLVYASRSKYKLWAILTDDYLKHCYKKLEAEEKIVVFGCSFQNDEHILEALMSGKDKEIYICYFDKNDLARFQKKIKNTKNKIAVCESKGIYPKLCRS
ncbi:MAG: DUF4917 family protein [Candidatus Paracaedibacteraceae bacterium]|nr:DUF4917 family protein [Candidatus Paracaedibacteraceae bacterium]